MMIFLKKQITCKAFYYSQNICVKKTILKFKYYLPLSYLYSCQYPSSNTSAHQGIRAWWCHRPLQILLQSLGSVAAALDLQSIALLATVVVLPTYFLLFLEYKRT